MDGHVCLRALTFASGYCKCLWRTSLQSVKVCDIIQKSTSFYPWLSEAFPDSSLVFFCKLWIYTAVWEDYFKTSWYCTCIVWPLGTYWHWLHVITQLHVTLNKYERIYCFLFFEFEIKLVHAVSARKTWFSHFCWALKKMNCKLMCVGRVHYHFLPVWCVL